MFIIAVTFKYNTHPIGWVVSQDDIEITISHIERAEDIVSFSVKDRLGSPIRDPGKYFGIGRLAKDN